MKRLKTHPNSVKAFEKQHEIVDDESLDIPGMEQIREQIISALNAFGNILRNTKRIAKKTAWALPALLALNNDNPAPELKVYGQNEKVNSSNLPFAAKIANRVLNEEPVNLYNQLLDLKNRRTNGEMTSEEIAIKEKISRNVYPGEMGGTAGFGEWLYLLGDKFHSPTETDSNINRFEDFVTDKGHFSKSKIEEAVTKGKIRSLEIPSVDLFRIYLGLPQWFDTMENSSYRPTKAKDKDAKYISFKNEEYLGSLHEQKVKGRRFDFFPFSGQTFEEFKEYVKDKKRLPGQYIYWNLHGHTANIGYDPERKEEYISYYDIWDFDVSSLEEIGINFNQFNFPPEIYGRIYQHDFVKYFK